MKITYKNYQKEVKKFASVLDHERHIAHMMLGIIEETKEFNDATDIVNKLEEIGDKIWFTSQMYEGFDLDFSVDLEKIFDLQYSYTSDYYKLLYHTKRIVGGYAKDKDVQEIPKALFDLTNSIMCDVSRMNTDKSAKEFIEEIMQINYNKLSTRYNEKFDANKAVNRDTEKEYEVMSK